MKDCRGHKSVAGYTISVFMCVYVSSFCGGDDYENRRQYHTNKNTTHRQIYRECVNRNTE